LALSLRWTARPVFKNLVTIVPSSEGSGGDFSEECPDFVGSGSFLVKFSEPNRIDPKHRSNF